MSKYAVVVALLLLACGPDDTSGSSKCMPGEEYFSYRFEDGALYESCCLYDPETLEEVYCNDKVTPPATQSRGPTTIPRPPESKPYCYYQPDGTTICYANPL